ncbi:hypothetical protein D3C78_1376510 [compost metagenome]
MLFDHDLIVENEVGTAEDDITVADSAKPHRQGEPRIGQCVVLDAAQKCGHIGKIGKAAGILVAPDDRQKRCLDMIEKNIANGADELRALFCGIHAPVFQLAGQLLLVRETGSGSFRHHEIARADQLLHGDKLRKQIRPARHDRAAVKHAHLTCTLIVFRLYHPSDHYTRLLRTA